MRSALTVHIKRCQNKEERVRKFACDMCDKLFFEPDKVRKHKRFVHLKLRNYRCDECGDTFRDLKMVGFESHQFIHVNFLVIQTIKGVIISLEILQKTARNIGVSLTGLAKEVIDLSLLLELSFLYTGIFLIHTQCYFCKFVIKYYFM